MFDPIFTESDLIARYLVFGIIPVFFILISFILRAFRLKGERNG